MTATTTATPLASTDRAAPPALQAIDKDDTPSRIWDLIPFWPAAVLTPALVLGIAGLVGRGPRLLRKNPALAGLLTGVALLGIAKWQLGRLFTETPDYEVERAFDGFEVRHYPSRVVAETTVEGLEHEDALNEGFRRLAGYIFGDNEGARSAMAAPIELREKARAGRTSKGEHIAMTSPVTSHDDGRGHVVTFTMPKHRALELLPVPTDARVRVRRTGGERFAVLTYRGTYRGELAEAKQAELLARVKEARLVPRGAPLFAGYDAPSTLPALRRVEAWVELEP